MLTPNEYKTNPVSFQMDRRLYFLQHQKVGNAQCTLWDNLCFFSHQSAILFQMMRVEHVFKIQALDCGLDNKKTIGMSTKPFPTGPFLNTRSSDVDYI